MSRKSKKKRQAKALLRQGAVHPSTSSHSRECKDESRHLLLKSDTDNVAPAVIDYGLQFSYDENLLERARTHWQLGEWEALAKLSAEGLHNHPDRAKLALLAAAGHLQRGDVSSARQYVRFAKDWGCNKRLISQVLIAGVHNTLGRAAAAAGQEDRARQHFESSIASVASQSDIRLLGRTRNIFETTKLGLLPQAARLMGEELSAMKRESNLGSARSRIFETELGLLQHELSLAQQRQQLFHATQGDRPEAIEGSQDWTEALRKKSVSQLGQDLWVLEKTRYKHNGYFVEFGATDGVLLSNTWLLEREFGWRGICAEPNPQLFHQLKQNRRCIASPACIGGETGREVEFILADAYGCIAEYADKDMHKDKRAAYRSQQHVATLKTISLHDLLTECRAPQEIDYLSIDTEGSEFEILQAFPFDKWHISFLTVEHNYTPRRADIRALLGRHGYRCTERQFDDWYELDKRSV